MARAVVNQQALRAALRVNPEAQAALDLTITALKDAAEAESPVQTSYFQDRFRTSRYPLSRRLRNVDPFAHLVEYGSIHNLVYAPMRRAARRFRRLRFQEKPK